jgi:hypothetical protein
MMFLVRLARTFGRETGPSEGVVPKTAPKWPRSIVSPDTGTSTTLVGDGV